MKWILRFSIIALLAANLQAVGEAGAIFLLIVPGAGPAATGEAQVAKVDDAYATFFNPSGLAFLTGKEIALMHVNWLPNLASDLYYEFATYRQDVDNLGTFGGHIAFLNLGEQIRTDENGNEIGSFRSNMWAITGSFGTKISPRSSVGVSAKIFHQNLISGTTGAESGNGKSTDFAFDVGYLLKMKKVNFGASITNIGPKISFIDAAQADPAPTNMRLGVDVELFNDGFNKVNILADANKLLVASYSSMDWDGDGLIGGWDSKGHESPGKNYNKKGDLETAHTDKVYKALITSWLDGWYYGGDLDKNSDRKIGGYQWNDIDGDGKIYQGDDTMVNGDNCPLCELYQDDAGIYNDGGDVEKGTGKDRSFSTEFKEMVYNFGIEYWYTTYFVLRGGYIYDQEGKITVPTFGAGIRFENYGFDFGYTAADKQHPRGNTMYFSLNMIF